MREFEYSKKFERLLSKLLKKDKVAFENIKKKIIEILTCDSVHHYKNLRRPLHSFKRVHVNASFVIVFSYDENLDVVYFDNYAHHDNIYKK